MSADLVRGIRPTDRNKTKTPARVFLMTKSSQAHVVILGSGFGAVQTAKHLNTSRARVTLISPRNHFLFTPLLVSTTTGKVGFRHISEPVRSACTDVTYRQAACTAIDPGARTVQCESPEDGGVFTEPYDHLVVAVGGENSTFGIEGVHGHAVFLKELRHAENIRHRLLGLLERAMLPETPESERRRLLHWVVVGGGPTGSEFAAELHDFLEEMKGTLGDLRPFARITLLEAAEDILPSFDQALQDYAEEHFRREGIDVRKNTPATTVHADRITLADGGEIPCGLVVWSTGIRPRSWVAESGLATDERGFLRTDAHCRVAGQQDVYAIGDCARVEDSSFPATAQLAQQQGRYLGKALRRRLRGKDVKPFRFRHLGMMASLGDKTAMADLPKGSIKGRTAWWIWRSVYFTKLMGGRNKLRLLGDWLHTRLFGRETSRI
jgi:NADH:ubiquinone reductase (non-electrogenic)